ncbi:hypothetical protein CENSYa_0883 [Cenarchaeum symbiosum A]|uniref:Uncharacterized protein n=1 Tax=Cenarchaeum symbiosum (strain A) TaxID=414004 RepID=A0RVZ8_CENSY|nr:hypothetical protein CENSYa_0883 [Cenarchaeum symbiosum A]
MRIKSAHSLNFTPAQAPSRNTVQNAYHPHVGRCLVFCGPYGYAVLCSLAKRNIKLGRPGRFLPRHQVVFQQVLIRESPVYRLHLCPVYICYVELPARHPGLLAGDIRGPDADLYKRVFRDGLLIPAMCPVKLYHIPDGAHHYRLPRLYLQNIRLVLEVKVHGHPHRCHYRPDDYPDDDSCHGSGGSLGRI